MTETITVYISIDNSYDKLTQNEWAHYVALVREAIRNLAFRQHSEWFSSGDSPWQNACWCVEVQPVMVDDLKARLAREAKAFNQNSIAWAAVPVTEFIGSVVAA